MSLTKLETIVYASDLTGQDSRKAFRVAATHALAHNARLIFINVVEPISATAEQAVSNYLTDDQINEMKTQGIKAIEADILERIETFCLEELPEELQNAIQSEIVIVNGKPDEKILEIAKQAQADMIVLGTRCHSKFSQIVIGSTSHKVLYQSDCPVLIVPIN